MPFLYPDSVDTPSVMRLMRELVLHANVYLSEVSEPNAKLLGNIAQYLAYLLQVFGVIPQERALGFSSSRGQEMSQVVLQFLVLL